MQTTPPPALPSSPPRWRRRLVWGVGALVLLEVLYNALLVTGLLGDVLTHFVHNPRISWRHAWSLVPGRVHVQDLLIASDEPNGAKWSLAFERVEVNVSLLALFKPQLRTSSVEVWGLTVNIDTVVPQPGAEAARSPPPKDPFTLLLEGVHVNDVREFRLDAARLTGISDVTGSLDMVPGQRIVVKDARLKFLPGELLLDKATVAHVGGGSLGATLQVERQEPEGLDLITGLDAELKLSAELPSLEGIKRLSPRFAAVPLRGGAGHLDVEVHVKEGRLAQGTRIEGAGAALVLPVLKPLEVKAPWRLLADVYTQKEGEERFGLKLTLGPVKLTGGEGPAVEAPEVDVKLSSKPPRLGEPLPDVHLMLQSARSKPVNLRMLNGWFGPSFQVESGHLTLEATSRSSLQKPGGEAHLELSTEDALVHWGGALVGGKLLLDVDARRLAFVKDTVTFQGSRLTLRDILVRTGKEDARGWDGTLSFPEASLTLTPFSLAGSFTGSFTSAAPFLALLSHQGVLPRILSPLLTAKNLELTGDVALSQQGLKAERVHAQGDGLEVRAWADATGAVPHAVMLVKLGPLTAGVETGAEGLHVELLGAPAWYTQKTGEKVD